MTAVQSSLQRGRPLTRDDADHIRASLPTGAFSPAEYAFANIWLFRQVHRYRYAEDPIPHIRGLTYDGAIHAMPISAVDGDAADALFADGIDCLYPFGEEGPELGRQLGCEVEYRDADSDYWFCADAMAKLSAAKTRRSQARIYFEQNRPSFESWHAGLAEAAHEILEGWSHDVTRAAEQTDLHECREAIVLADWLGLEGGVVWVGSTPVAFLLASVSANARVVHFAKGRRAHSHAYPWMFATYARQSGALWLNFEQDLGIQGLAQSKRAYRPARIQPKYRLIRGLSVRGNSIYGRDRTMREE